MKWNKVWSSRRLFALGIGGFNQFILGGSEASLEPCNFSSGFGWVLQVDWSWMRRSTASERHDLRWVVRAQVKPLLVLYRKRKPLVDTAQKWILNYSGTPGTTQLTRCSISPAEPGQAKKGCRKWGDDRPRCKLQQTTGSHRPIANGRTTSRCC